MWRQNKLNNYLKLWEEYSRLGALAFFLKSFGCLLFVELSMALMGVVYFSYLALSSLVIGLFALLVIAGAILTHLAVLMAQRTEQWLCFGVTMVTTLSCGLYVTMHLGHRPHGLLLVFLSLMAGVLSGGLSEGLRRFMAKVSFTQALGLRFQRLLCRYLLNPLKTHFETTFDEGLVKLSIKTLEPVVDWGRGQA